MDLFNQIDPRTSRDFNEERDLPGHCRSRSEGDKKDDGM